MTPALMLNRGTILATPYEKDFEGDARLRITAVSPVSRGGRVFYGWDGGSVAGITRSAVSLSKKLMQ